jgi:DNA-nicking Smr family endonuclease
MGQGRKHLKSPQQVPAKFAHQPFRSLKQVVIKQAAALPVQTQPKAAKVVATVEAAPEPDSGELFRRAVAGVEPLQERERDRVAHPAPASPPRAITDPDAEALAELCDLVSGNSPFDIQQTDEHIEGTVVGLDPRLLRRLRNGEFAYQGHLDLHGMYAEEARGAVESFLMRAHQQGKRCVLIIHGRGLNSKDQTPVLKTRLTGWLARGQWARLVLAFTSARACDGGVGALYVLLRRQRQARQPMRVTNGAKW